MKKDIFRKIIYFIFTILFFISCKSYLPYTEDMKNSLRNMYQEDQRLQNELISSIQNKKPKKYIDSIDNKKKDVFIENQLEIKRYYDLYGFPYTSKNDKFSSFAFWIIVQHSDDNVDFQKRVLKSMKKGLKTNDVDSKNYAFLYDRVMKNTNKKQLYGTQMITDSLGKQRPYPIEDILKVDVRRKEMGLGTLEEYLLMFKK